MVRLELALLSYLITIAVKEWGMSGLVNPEMQIRKPKLPRGRERRLLPGELERIINASESPILHEIGLFALETAMRREEIASMAWNMVDLKKRTVTLPETKNGEKRIVPLSSEAVRILSGLLRRLDNDVWGMRRIRSRKPSSVPSHAPGKSMRRNAKKRERSRVRAFL